jgi:hypothetical protein
MIQIAALVRSSARVAVTGAVLMTLTWHPQEAPVPSGALATGLNTVSCASSTACMTVGNYEGSGSTFDAFTESWNGSNWTIQSTPNPGNSYLSGVSCPSASDCIAVGDVASGSDLVTLAQVWNGSSWTVQSTPSPSGATDSYLVSISCTSSTACTAAGFYRNGAGDDLPLAEAWNGSSWSLQSTPDPSGTTTAEFTGVSCSSSADVCVAVGYYLTPSYTVLAEVWNGTSWTIDNPSLPAGGSGGYLGGVSCTPGGSCIAVGDYSNASNTVVTLAEFWNTSAWTVQATQNRVDAKDSYLDAVSCASATSCTAVGSVYHSGPVHTVTLAERWNGSSWHLSAPGAPSGATGSNLASVSCTSQSNCMGAGWYYNGSDTELPLVAPYN